MTGTATILIGLALVLSLLQCATRHERTIEGLVILQAIAVAAVLALRAQPWAGGVMLASGVAMLPLALGWLRRRRLASDDASDIRPKVADIAAGAVLALVAMPFSLVGQALAVTLIGLLLVVTRPGPSMRLLALMSMQQGVALASAIAQPADQVLALLFVLPLVPAMALGVAVAIRPNGRREA